MSQHFRPIFRTTLSFVAVVATATLASGAFAANLPADWWDKYAYDFPAKPELMKFARRFGPELAKHGHVVSHWPKEYGGMGATLAQQIIISEEMARLFDQVTRKAATQTGPSILNEITDADIDKLFND